MRVGESLIQIKSLLQVRACLAKRLRWLHHSDAYRAHLRITVSDPCIGWRKSGIDGKRLLKVRHAQAYALRRHLVPEVASSQISVVCNRRTRIAARPDCGTGKQ